MKRTLIILVFAGLVTAAYAQKLSLKPGYYSEPIGMGAKVSYEIVLTNDTEAEMLLFRSPMADYKVGGYEYTISCNGKEILHAKTRGLDTNEHYGDKRITALPAGESQSLLGLRSFTIEEAGTYEIHARYYQDPSNLVEGWADNKKTIKKARKITPYSAEVTETFEVK